jgi:hypothetical protein
MTRALSVVLASLVACTAPSSGPAPSTAAPSVPPPPAEPTKPDPPPAAEPAKPEPARPPEPPKPDPPEVAAAKAYTTIIKSAASEQLLAGYADQLACFGAKKKATRDDVRKARVDVETGAWTRGIPQPRLVDPSTVLLLERAVETDADNRPHVREQVVLMRRVADSWQIAGETDVARAACLGVDLGDLKPDPVIADCDKQTRACMKQCTCKVASNSCESCKDGCTSGALACLGIAD